jgi:hypothetical protein
MKNFVPDYIVRDVCDSPRVKNYMMQLKTGRNPIDLADMRELVRLALQEGAEKIVESNK